ncbi:Fe-S oxidoreductase [Desulfotomaculum arcticum]|uniref:Fe-S oxidoreductase n=1 Tax=Desulfotruncus arcticus DSM 17038 TaxID=1121424 RepID=A0A1I2U3Z5_9FIRM|nr:(Fe-S)-binding protein [Desulfotruncus arcticus]SFG71872.1 Fe-S oxidoreductase [Desulfotomaculum arcticum] [Desulfotruncus arcticus DSM 17038]
MPLPTGDTIGILADNLRKRKSVLPISAGNATKWASGLSLPRGTKTVLYTGMMYQLIPYIAAMSKAQAGLEDSFLVNFIKLGRQVNKVVNISAFMAMPSKSMKEAYNQILVNIATLLQQAGVQFGYLYEEELYSGALIYDLGVDDLLNEHAHKVYNTFKKHGVKNVITVDPHTTNMLRSVYPTMIKGYDLKVKSYLEVLVERKIQPQNSLNLEAVIHDSCVYARYENVLNEQRTLLTNAGMDVKEPENSGKFTLCCGGPAESLYPKKAKAGAQKRFDQLIKVSSNAVTMCPICFVNLQKAAGDRLHLGDISTYLVQAYCGAGKARATRQGC